MEEEGGKTKLIVGIIAAIIIVAIGFFIIRSFMTKKSSNPNNVPNNFVTPTSFNTQDKQQITPTPSVTSPSGAGTSGSTIYYYYPTASQTKNGSSQSQNGGTQTQTLPNGMTQTQSY